MRLLLSPTPQGFTQDWFVFFYNQDGGQPYSQVAAVERLPGGKEALYVTTPRVAAYTRVRS